MVEEKTAKTVVTIPTYNEKENIRELIQAILALPWTGEVSVLVVDDNSPDGTEAIVAGMAESDQRIRVLVRTKRRGRGAAGIDGFKEALRMNASLIVEMDGDFSHQPEFIPRLVQACEDSDIAIGSRFVPGGKDADRNFLRRTITHLVRLFIRNRFGFPVKDVSSGFRCFRRAVLERIDLDDMISVGPAVVLEVLYKASLLGFRMTEVPIAFIDRKKGKTKLNLLTLVETLVMTLKFKRQYASFGKSKTT